MLAHTLGGGGPPLPKILIVKIKKGLKFSMQESITSGLVGVVDDVPRGKGDKVGTKIREGKKSSKIRHDF